MVMLDNIQGSMSCPKCKKEPPFNFRVETRITLRGTEQAYTVIESATFYVCTECGYSIRVP